MGTLIDKVSIARPFILQKLKTIPQVENEADFIRLLEKFFSFSLPKVYDAKTLAMELAKRTRFLKDEVIAQELRGRRTERKGIYQEVFIKLSEIILSVVLQRKNFQTFTHRP